MELLNKIDDKTVIVCTNKNKKKILNEIYNNKKIVDFKIMNLKEFIKKMTFSYSTETIYYLMQKYNVTYDNAVVYLDNLYYIDNQDYGVDKLKKLLDIKQDLIFNNLLLVDDLFKENIISKKIIFYDLKKDYKFLKKITSNLDIEFIEKEYFKYIDKTIFCFETIEEEINYVAGKICSLIENGIAVEKIKLFNLPSEYKFLLKNIFYNYGLFVEYNEVSLFSTIIGQFFLDNLDSNINMTIEKIKNNFNLENDETFENINKIISICNKYTWCDDFLKIKDCLIYELKHTSSYCRKYNNYIEIIDFIDSDFDLDSYIFLMGFNQENYPKIYKDDSYIDDRCAKILGIETSSDKNIYEKEELIKIILSIKNLTITYKNKTNFGRYYISSLNDYLSFKIENINCTNHYSLLNTKIEYTKKLDSFIKYGEKAEDLDFLYSNLQDIHYRTYNNKFKGINIDDLKEYLNSNLLLSYSSIDNFYKCGFSYYINNILKLNLFDEKFGAYIGSLIHYILSVAFKKGFNFEDEVDKYVNNCSFELTSKNRFFLSKIKKELKNIIETIQKQKTLTNFDNELYEQKIYIEKQYNIHITFMGIIDKIMYMKKDGLTYLSIVDYKTGLIDTNLKYINYGLHLQLPIYAYLILKSNLFDNPIISGLYYQKLLFPEIKATTIEDYQLQKYNNLKLIGLSSCNQEILQQFDSTYENSELIKGMKLTSKGFSSYSKVYSQNELKDILKIVDDKIENAIKDICNGQFHINPKRIKKDNISCKYCKFKDLCYMTEADVEILEEGD